MDLIHGNDIHKRKIEDQNLNYQKNYCLPKAHQVIIGLFFFLFSDTFRRNVISSSGHHAIVVTFDYQNSILKTFLTYVLYFFFILFPLKVLSYWLFAINFPLLAQANFLHHCFSHFECCWQENKLVKVPHLHHRTDLTSWPDLFH